jgi:uncharacterized membrane protein YvlD (DUF360 family)
MLYLFLNWTLGTAGLALLAIVLPACRVDELRSLLVAAAVVALVHAAISSAFRSGSDDDAVLTLPAVFLALGDSLVFRVVALLVPGFAMRSFYPALAGGVLLLVLNLALPRLFRHRGATAEPAMNT